MHESSGQTPPQLAAASTEDLDGRAIEIFDVVPEEIFLWNASGNIAFANRSLLEVLGISLADMQKEEFCLRCYHPDDFAAAEAAREKSLASGERMEIKARVRRKDGQFTWFLIRSTPVRKKNGQIAWWYGTLTDIDGDLKRAEAAARESERKLRDLVETIPVMAFSVMPDGSTEFITRSWLEYTGLPSEDNSRMGWMPTIHPDDCDDHVAKWQASLANGEPFENVVRHRSAEGVYRWFLVRAVPLRDKQGRILKWYGTLTDIEERKRAEEALRLAEHLARGQAEALQQALVSLSRESEPEKFLQHVLCITCRQMGAHSLTVWELNDKLGRLERVAVCENGLLSLPSPGGMQTLPRRAFTDDDPVWTEFFQTGDRCVYSEFEVNPLRIRSTTNPNGPWHDAQWIPAASAQMQKKIEHNINIGVKATLVVPMIFAGRVTGMYNILFTEKRQFRREEIELARAMTHQALLALQLVRLSQQSRDAAVMAERNRMARDIHDTLAQGFTGIIAHLQAAKGAVELTEAAAHIEIAENLARASLEEARRSVRALRPRPLHATSLVNALERILRTTANQSGLSAGFHIEGDERPLSPEWEEALLRIAQESLTNTIKHAKARHFTTRLIFEPHQLQLKLTDDGTGFDLAAERNGFGLMGMKERVDQMGGDFTIHSELQGGTEIIVSVPCKLDLETFV